MVVLPNRAIDLGNQFSQRPEPVRISQINLELAVEGFLVSILPRTPGKGTGDADAES